MTHASESELRAAVAAIQAKTSPSPGRAQASTRAAIWRHQQIVRKQLQSFFADAGLDIQKIEEIIAQDREGVARILEKQKAEASAEFAELSRTYRQGIRNQADALKHIAGKPLTITPIPLETPYGIYATPIGMLTDSHTEPHNNWAKFRYQDTSDTVSREIYLKFWFIWQNTTKYLAVINANADLLTQGFCEAWANPGIFSAGSSSVNVRATLNAYVGPAKYISTPYLVQLGTVSAHGGVFLGGTVDIETINVNTVTNLSVSTYMIVQDGQYVVFELALFADYWIDGGGLIGVDFNQDDRTVMCPGLTVELLTAPGVARVA
jgi:hypothetical protein